MEDRSTRWLALGAFLCIAAGGLVYLGARPEASAYLLPTAWAGAFELPWLSGRIGQSLPSLAHAFAFSTLTGLCLRPWRHAALAACAFWLVIDAAFEIAQVDALGNAVASRLPVFFTHWPVLNHAGAYLKNGRFDVMDLVFTVLGCALAWWLLRRRASP